MDLQSLLLGMDPRLINPALNDPLATDPFQPEQGLLERLLPMLQAPRGPTPGFGGPPTEMSAQPRVVAPVQPQAQPVQPPRPLQALGGPDLEAIMQSQGSTRPLPYPMAGGGPSQMPAPAPSPQAAPGQPPSAVSPTGGGMLPGLAGGGMGGLIAGLGPVIDIARGALSGVISPQTAAQGAYAGRGEAAKWQQMQMMYQVMVAQGIPPQKAMLTALNPELAEKMGFFERPMSKEVEDQKTRMALAAKGPTVVAEGGTAIGPSGQPVFTAPPKKEKPTELRPGGTLVTPDGKPIYTAPKTDSPISPTDKKAIFEAEDEIPATKGTIEALNRALELNNKTFSGALASTRGWVGTNLPGGSAMVDADKAKATQEWERIMAPEALKTMANTLKGATTDFELRKFIEMLGDPTTHPDIRASVINRLKLLAERHLQTQQQRIKELRSGEYFKPTGGGNAPAPESGGYRILGVQ